MREEIIVKEKRIFNLLNKKVLDGVLIFRTDNFAWITGGASNFVNKFTEEGIAALLITKDNKYLITNKIEKYRLVEEEVSGLSYELISYEWYNGCENVLSELFRGKKIGSDNGLSGTVNIREEIKELRYMLTNDEIERARKLGRICAESIQQVCRELKQGDTEYEIAANLTRKLMSYNAEAPVVLVAADDRVFKYRHPIPTDKKVEKYVMVVLGARQYGLNISLTRLVHFGELSDEIRRKHESCVKIDSVAITETKPGRKVSDIFGKIISSYEAEGYGEEWKLHHQGGPAGYEGRDFVATPYTHSEVVSNQLYAWNPSISGVKSEDTILVNDMGYEILTEINDWPMTEVEVNKKVIKRPGILIR
jgi:Xaa-Pro dipeptidase